MKRIFQSGGVVSYTPFIPQSGATQTTTSNSGTKQDKITGTLQEEIVKVLKENGIQNDVDAFLSQANAFLNKSKNLSGVSLFGGENPDYTMTDLIGVLSMANRVKENKNQYNTAVTRLKDEDAGQEVALTSNGRVYIYNKDEGLKTISSSDYYKNRDKYQLLTNSQVLGLRENSPELTFNDEILKDLAAATGLKTITDQLVETITKFGMTTRQEYIKNTGDVISQSVYDGMQMLIGQGPEAYYKVTTKSERDDIQNALSYLWRTIGVKGQARLRAETAVSGGDPDKNQYDLILQMIKQHTDYSQTPDIITSTIDDGSNSGNGKNPPLDEDPRVQRIARGDGQLQEITIVPRVDRPNEKQSAITAKAYNFGQLLDDKGHMLEGHMSLREVLKADPVFGAQTDAKNITFGNIHLNSKDLDRIVVDTNWNNLSGVYLPYKEDGAGFVPDLEMQETYKRVQGLLDSNPNMTGPEIQKLLQKEGIDSSKIERIKLDNGQVVWKLKTKYFLTFSAYGNDDLLKSIRDNKRYFEHIGEEGGTWLRKDARREFDPKLFNDVTMYGSSTHKKEAQKVVSRSILRNDDWDYDNAYMGNVFVAIDPIRASYVVDNQLMEKSLLTKQIQRMILNENSQDPAYIGNFNE